MPSSTQVTFDTTGIVFSNDDLVFDIPPMSPSANVDEMRQYVAWLDHWRRIREQLCAGGVLAKMVTFRDLVKYGLLNLSDAGIFDPPPTSATGNVVYRFACSDLTSDLEPNAYAGYFRADFPFTVRAVRASLLEPSVSGSVTVKLWLNGSPMLSTNLSIDVNEKSSKTAAVPAVLSASSLTDDIEVIAEILNAGSGARGLEVAVIGRAV